MSLSWKTAKPKRKMDSSSAQEKDCPICLESIDPRGGRAIFTAECSHSFHFHCIVSNVKHGNRTCPLCKTNWKQLPFESSSPPPRHSTTVPFADDEPLEETRESAASGNAQVDLQTFLEFPAVKRSTSLADFSFVIHLKAPSVTSVDSPRPAVDLVAVLDVSGSMGGSKLQLLKNAMAFVIGNLSCNDRLSVVTFSDEAERIFGLTRMTETGKSRVLEAVNKLKGMDLTNIADGLCLGAKVLDDRRQKNPVCSIIFLSDGQDNCRLSRELRSQPNALKSLLPSSIVGGSSSINSPRIPVHAFGFGTDHDATLMNSISEVSGGTFSFVENPTMIEEAFAQCIGGLLSVVAQELRVEMECTAPQICINEIMSGRYANELVDDRRRGAIEVGELYAYEERDFLVSVNLPAKEEDAVMEIRCTYKEPLTKCPVKLEAKKVIVPRPVDVKPGDCIPSAKVKEQQKRLEATVTVGAAQRAADMGDFHTARSMLEKFRRMLSRGNSRSRMDETLDGQFAEMECRMESPDTYRRKGRAYMMSTSTSHGGQRACTAAMPRAARVPSLRTARSSAVDGAAPSSAIADDYRSPVMEEMLTRLRGQQAVKADEKKQGQSGDQAQT